MTNDLDTFEAQLLGELRSVVASRTKDIPARRPDVPRRRRRAMMAAVSAASAATAIAFILTGTFAEPAYAVGDGPRGTIAVQVNRLEDAAGLEKALAKEGVAADVAYLGFQKQCAGNRYTPAGSTSGSATSFTIGTDGISMVLDRRDVSNGETVVITASRIPQGVWGSVGIATGEVRDCRPVLLDPSQWSPNS